VVLAEEELVVIDLQTPGWPPVQLPYLASLHCSAITCSHHVSNIPLKLWERIIAAGSRQNSHFSTMVGPALALSPLLSWAQVLLDFLFSSSRSGP
jgi:lethal(2) giant larvae protein